MEDVIIEKEGPRVSLPPYDPRISYLTFVSDESAILNCKLIEIEVLNWCFSYRRSMRNLIKEDSNFPSFKFFRLHLRRTGIE